MSRDVLIGLDSGTSVVKAVAFDLEGTPVEHAARPNTTIPVDGAGMEQEFDRTWDDAALVLRELAAKLAARGLRVAGIAVTGQGDGTWLIDRDGDPVGRAMLWHDGRSGPIVAELHKSGTAKAVQRFTGTMLNMSNQSGQLLWLKRHRPEALARAATAFHCKDWLYFRMTGERVTDVSEGTFTFGDYRSREYAPEVQELFDLKDEARLLPPMVDGVRQNSALTPQAAIATGLPAGTPVVLAPVDLLCGALGSGLYDPEGRAGFTVLGSTGAHMRLVFGADRVTLGDEVGYTMPFVVPGSYVSMVSNMAATLNIDWLCGVVEEVAAAAGATLPKRSDLIRLLDAKAAAARPGRLLYHPFIAEAGERGPFVDSAARASVIGLSGSAGAGDLLRAIYESLGFASRDCYEAVGGTPAEIRLAGGAARSATVRGILAAATDAPVRLVKREEVGAAGAAMVAALSLGILPDIDAACARWVTPLLAEAEMPDPALVAQYDRLFPQYRASYRALRPIWHALEDLRTEG
ncbi:carbohydrate kinase [Mycobacterium sp. KBS0706]|uniref:FGGY-family carbohydrate kinase n=1 Tax=Mycobacterium sp. KBS0706 TaxID=2578109 RepID=UPI00110FD695|nr:FGGY-family carbohydrate kinase [Mycobacterium sp. KBS0706]TSD87603.1 carbohydrate kinase [Mycobacterium sp. KBS0706]